MSAARRRWLPVVVAAIAWLVLVLPAYYVVHKPAGAAQAAAIGSAALDVALLAVTVMVAAGWGSRAMRWLGAEAEPGAERWALAATLGLGLLGTLVLLLGAAGLLYRWVAFAVLVVLALGVVPELRAAARWAAGLLRRPEGPIPWLPVFTGIVGALALGRALLPPTAWDALAYHLTCPQLYTQAHRLVAAPENFYLNWPAQVEMLFAWGMLLTGDVLAQLFHWAFWVLTAALIYGAARRAIDERAGQWAVALWAAVPLASTLAAWPYADLGLTAFVMAAFCCFLRWTESERDGWAVLAAVFAGLAVACKYTAVTWMAALGALFVFHAWRSRRPARWIAGRGLLLAAVAGLMVAPWLVKNWIMVGNPIYPVLFGGEGWNATRAGFLTLGGYGYSGNVLDYLALPWLATVLGTAGTGAFDATIGPLLLCLVPLAFLARGRPRAVNYGLVMVGAHWLYFLVTAYRYVFMAQTRLILPVFPLLCLAGAAAMRCLPAWDRPALRLSWVVRAVAVGVLALTLASEVIGFVGQQAMPVLLGIESRASYLGRELGAYLEAVRSPELYLPGAGRAMFFWEPRGYYGPLSAQADPTLDNLPQLRLAYGTVEAAQAALRERGFTHLLFYRAGLEILSEPTPRAPTLGSLGGHPPAGHSFYPITDDDRRFLAELLARSELAGRVGDSYEIYRLP